MGICPDFPVKGVSLLLENDLAGDKVMINPCVSSHPCSPENTKAEMQDTPGPYPACAVTRTMAKKQLTAIQNSQNEEAKSDVQGQQSVFDALEGTPDLSDVFKSHMDRSTANFAANFPTCFCK